MSWLVGWLVGWLIGFICVLFGKGASLDWKVM